MFLGTSPGEGRIDGELTMGPNSELDIEFAGTEAKNQYDQLEVTGTVSLGGKLVLSFIYGY